MLSLRYPFRASRLSVPQSGDVDATYRLFFRQRLNTHVAAREIGENRFVVQRFTSRSCRTCMTVLK